MKRAIIVAACGLLALAFGAGRALALDKLHVARAGAAIAFAGIEVGDETGIWKKYGLEIEAPTFGGDAKVEQALTAGEVEIGFCAGPSMAYRVKGVPAVAVAVIAGPPYSFVIATRPDSPLKSAADLKGKRVGITTAGSGTYWMVRELSRREGWGLEGIVPVPLGEQRARAAALKNGDIDASVMTSMAAFDLEANHAGRILLSYGDIIKDYITHLVLASDKLIATNPDLLRRFLKGWFESVAYMKTHRAEGERIAAKAMNMDPQIIARAYEEEMRMLSDDGVFDPAAIELLRYSFVDLGLLDKVPEAKLLYRTDFVPVKF
jgi:NitT/TauT family transport system substrate-binding protein